MEQPILRLQKNVENTNKIRLPKKVVETLGKEYYMEIYENKIVLVPMNRREK